MPVTIITEDAEPRPIGPALLRGIACKCPNCGKGKLFRAYLKTNDICANCGEEIYHHRADDLPPYLSIVIFGHILIGAMLHMEMTSTGNVITYMSVFLPMAIVLPIITLPSIKGAVVALQWALRMHGFDPNFKAEL